MLELKNVAVKEACNPSNPFVADILMDYNPVSVQDLIDVLPNYPELYLRFVDKDLKLAKRGVELAQKRGREPVLYECKPYADESLKYTDTLNDGDVLLLSAPTTDYSTTFLGINRLSIARIKEYLMLTNCKGNNYLVSSSRNISSNMVPRILEAIDMYSEQVIRQSQLTDSRDINLFMYQQEEKREIVLEKYAEIIAYLIYNTREFVWGGLSGYQRKQYLSSVVNGNYLKDRMVDNVVNYMTLPELEKVYNGNYKALKRFIKK